ncbi:MAG: hypothetical protein AAF443_00920, partial [Chlamydiota bacterium]
SKTFLKDEFIAKALWMRRKKAFGKVFASPSGRFLSSTETTRGELGLKTRILRKTSWVLKKISQSRICQNRKILEKLAIKGV